MPFNSRVFAPQTPAQVLVFALIATAVGIACLLAFILARRAARTRYFRRRDSRARFVRENWDSIVNGQISARAWFFNRIDRALVEETLLDRLETAGSQEAGFLKRLLRDSGLLHKRIRDVRRKHGWAKRRALLALGRMRVPESIPVLSEVLRDPNDEIVVDAIRALGHVGTPAAARPILERISERPPQCPPQTLQTALIDCYRGNAQLLLDDVLKAGDPQRPILARVLAEVAAPSIAGDLLSLSADPLPEVRASAARVLARVRPHYALSTLSLLASDKEWFVRLRATVAIGEVSNRRGIPVLLKALCDSNRLVRLRAASALAGFRGEEARILELATQMRDSYALQALVSEMERSGRILELVNGLSDETRLDMIEPALLAALKGGSMRILADLLLNHPKPCVRKRLARLVARSGDAATLQFLQQIDMPVAARLRLRLLGWVIKNLQGNAAAPEPERAVAV